MKRISIFLSLLLIVGCVTLSGCSTAQKYEAKRAFKQAGNTINSVIGTENADESAQSVDGALSTMGGLLPPKDPEDRGWEDDD